MVALIKQIRGLLHSRYAFSRSAWPGTAPWRERRRRRYSDRDKNYIQLETIYFDLFILSLYFTVYQNIDNLEEKAGIHQDKLIQAHGSLKGSAACAMCRKQMDPEVYKQHVKEGKVYRCTACQSPVKPNVVFFGEDLPQSFSKGYSVVEDCDLMIIMGTALAVAPFKHLVAWAPQAHQVLINRENTDKHGYDFEKGGNRLFLQGNCDDVTERLVKDIGLEEQFQALLPKREEEAKQ